MSLSIALLAVVMSLSNPDSMLPLAPSAPLPLDANAKPAEHRPLTRAYWEAKGWAFKREADTGPWLGTHASHKGLFLAVTDNESLGLVTQTPKLASRSASELRADLIAVTSDAAAWPVAEIDTWIKDCAAKKSEEYEDFNVEREPYVVTLTLRDNGNGERPINFGVIARAAWEKMKGAK